MTAASVEAIGKRASDALAGAYQQLATAVREQPVVHADETGWRWPGRRRWGWLASTEQIAILTWSRTTTSPPRPEGSGCRRPTPTARL